MSDRSQRSQIRPPPVLSPEERAFPGPPVIAREVLEGVRRREPGALATFFEAYFDRIYGLVYRLLGERMLAEDVTQDVFFKVHRAAHRLDPGRDPGPWLTVIAHNACRDVWRSGAYRLARRSAPVEEVPAPGGGPSSEGGVPERDLLAAERERTVRDAIRKLPPSLRAPVVLHDYQGLGHAEIAKLLGIRYAAARKRYSRALAALGKLLEGKLE